MKYRALTANCGNDVLGQQTSSKIAALLHKDNADFYIINCQEVSVEQTCKQLESVVGNGYVVRCLGQMTTHTKLSTQFHSQTGIATLIIHKKDITIDLQSSQMARRSQNRLSGVGYNKGGLVTDFTVTYKNDTTTESLHVEAVSGHLDSKNIQKRTEDWLNINRAISKEVVTWQELAAACPDLRVSGYDANTRNKLNKKGGAVNLWGLSSGSASLELQALYQASIAGQHFSSPSTYKRHVEDIDTTADKKRPGYSRGGMMDFIGIADGKASSKTILSQGISSIAPDAKDSERDHDVIISPLQNYVMPESEFERVKGQMVQRLERNAPHLVQGIKALVESEQSKAKMVAVYQTLLSPNGMLNQAIEMHSEQLGVLKDLTSPLQFEDKKPLTFIVDSIFFKQPWFAEARLDNMKEFSEQMKQKMELMRLLAVSLQPYPGAEETKHRVQLYQEQLQRIQNHSFTAEEAQQAFKSMQLKEHVAYSARLNTLLDDYSTDTSKLKHKGRNLLMQVKAIAPTRESLVALNTNDIGQLNAVLKYSADAIVTVNKGGDVTPFTSQLAVVAENSLGKSSSTWKKLGAGLLAFAGLLLVIAGVLAAIPTGGSSLGLAAIAAASMGGASGLVGVGALHHSKEKNLAKSVGDFKTALRSICYEDNVESNDSTVTNYKPCT